jgi:hypothetical protein
MYGLVGRGVAVPAPAHRTLQRIAFSARRRHLLLQTQERRRDVGVASRTPLRARSSSSADRAGDSSSSGGGGADDVLHVGNLLTQRFLRSFRGLHLALVAFQVRFQGFELLLQRADELGLERPARLLGRRVGLLRLGELLLEPLVLTVQLADALL